MMSKGEMAKIKGKRWARIIITTKVGIISSWGHKYLHRNN